MTRPLALSISLLVLLSVLSGCALLRDRTKDAPPGKVVAISAFKCNCDPLVRESVQDTFVDIFFKYTNAKPIKGETGDIVIVGVLTVEEGSTGVSKGKMSGAGSSTFAAIGGSSSGASAAGNYVSGMTFQVYKSGEMIATYSVGQNLGGGQLVSPIALGTTAAYYLSSALIRKNEIARP